MVVWVLLLGVLLDLVVVVGCCLGFGLLFDDIINSVAFIGSLVFDSVCLICDCFSFELLF